MALLCAHSKTFPSPLSKSFVYRLGTDNHYQCNSVVNRLLTCWRSCCNITVVNTIYGSEVNRRGGQMSRSESKSAAFRRLATKRTNAIIGRLRILGHCANPQLYEYSQDDVKKIFRVIETELRTAKAKFKNSARSEFQL